MSNVLRCLEALGQDATLSRLSPEERAQRMAGFGLSSIEQEAFADPQALAALLGARLNMVGVQFPGDEPQREEDEPRRDDDTPEEPDGESIAGSADRLH